jgi:phenylalanyl-tRNA synthetase beta chain
VPPPWRNDLVIAADLVEEVARIEGYDVIEAAVPSLAAQDISSREYELEGAIAQTMRALGYHEIITHSLHGAQRFERLDGDGATSSVNAVELRNPLSEDQRFLRMDIAPALIEYLSRLGRPYRLFEIGHVFAREGNAVIEFPVLTFVYSAEQDDELEWRDAEFFRLKGDLEALLRAATGRLARFEPSIRAGLHPGKTASATIDGVDVGVLGRVDPRLERTYGAGYPLYLSTVRLDRLPERIINRYHPPSRFPSTYRDLSLVLDPDVSAERVESVTAEAIGDLCTATRVFDEYRGPQVENDRKSLAVRVTMHRYDGTITDQEADAAIARAVEALREQLGASVRA